MKRRMCLILALVMAVMLTACGSAAPREPRKLSLGRAEGNTYTNEYLGLGISLDEDWKVYDATQIYNLPEEIANAADGEELEAAMEEVDLMNVLIATNSAGDIIQIAYNRQGMEGWEENKEKTEQETIDFILLDREEIIRQFADSGREVTRLEAVEVDFLGQKHAAIARDHVENGENVYYVQMADFSLGTYKVMLIFQCRNEDNTRDMIAQFYPLDK